MTPRPSAEVYRQALDYFRTGVAIDLIGERLANGGRTPSIVRRRHSPIFRQSLSRHSPTEDATALVLGRYLTPQPPSPHRDDGSALATSHPRASLTRR